MIKIIKKIKFEIPEIKNSIIESVFPPYKDKLNFY